MAGRRSSIISGCFRCARTCAGAMGCTSRSCRHCGGRTYRCGGPISRSGTPAIPTRRCEIGSSSAIARSSKPSWPSGPPIRSCCSTWARSPSSGRTGRPPLGYLQRSLRGSGPTDSIVRKLFALIARCHQMLGDLPAALAACAEGLGLDPDDAELHFRKAILHRKAGQPAEAEACWRRILTLKRPDRFCSVDQGIYGHLTWRSAGTGMKHRGSGSWCSPPVRGMRTRWRSAKLRDEASRR